MTGFLFSVLGLLGSGVTIGIALCAASMVFIMLDPWLNVETVGLSFFNFLQSYSLMAVPLYLQGPLMDPLWITKRIISRQIDSARSSRLLCSKLPMRAHRMNDSTGPFSL